MNAKKAKQLRRIAKQQGKPVKGEPFYCACGEIIPHPSFHVQHQVWVTERHYKSEIQWVPVRSKSGAVYKKPVTIYTVCLAYADNNLGEPANVVPARPDDASQQPPVAAPVL